MIIRVKNIIDEDFLQYKKPSMFIGFSRCNFKCGKNLCQNTALARSKDILVSTSMICERYNQNPITKAVVLGGLDPFDTPEECYRFCYDFRLSTADDIVIYTGYTEEEIANNDLLRHYHEVIIALKNVIIKYGRFIPNQESHYDEILGINLASPNQYAIRY